VLYRVISEHLEAFLETAKRQVDGAPLPEFVEQEFRDFLTCGVLAHGFARLRCTDCAFERLVPFSCKGRGFPCPLRPMTKLRRCRRCLSVQRTSDAEICSLGPGGVLPPGLRALLPLEQRFLQCPELEIR
jgi:hypothetical protein